MTTRDFLRLPLGDYKIKTKYRTYAMRKSFADWRKSNMYDIREWGSVFGGHISLYEYQDNVFDDSNYYKTIRLEPSAFVGGMYIKGDPEGIYYIIREFQLIPKSSYKEWLAKMEQLEITTELLTNA